MGELRDLSALVRAATPLLVIETQDEERVVALFRHVLMNVWRPMFRWAITEGLRRIDIDSEECANVAPDTTTTLRHIREAQARGVYILCDFHPYIGYAANQRMLREIINRRGSAAHTLVLVAPKVELPPELESDAVRFSLRLPDEQALLKMVREEAALYQKEHQGRRVEKEPEALSAMVRNLRGLSLTEARRVARQLIFKDGAIRSGDLPELAKLKFELLNQSGHLHFEYDTADFAQVAGLRRMKRWVDQRRAVFLSDNPPPGLDPPKGLLLLGVQGTGKSLAAKAVAGVFGVPLVRLDFGTLYNKYHGETEKNLREALSAAEQVAPCVLWMDEIEKGIASSDSDGGVSRRVLGYLLTWMAERKSQVFLVATANQVRELPPELLRKGRFDEIFFVDLPDEATRAEIFRIHLERRQIDWGAFSLLTLAEAADGFSGAEVEQAVVGALYAAHAAGRPLDEGLLLEEIRGTRPLSVIMAEQVNALREWAASRTVPAG